MDSDLLDYNIVRIWDMLFNVFSQEPSFENLIRFHREAQCCDIALSKGHPERPRLLNYYIAAYEQLRAFESERAELLIYLATTMRQRFLVSGDKDEMDISVLAAKLAVRRRSLGDGEQIDILSDCGEWSLGIFEWAHDESDLDASVLYGTYALEELPKSDHL